MSAREMSLTTIASSPLASSFRAPSATASLAVLGGEADQRLARAAALGQPGEHVAGGLELELRRSRPAFLSLPSSGAARPEVGDRRRHQQHVAGGELLLARPLQLAPP